jgi:hypothetical protein
MRAAVVAVCLAFGVSCAGGGSKSTWITAASTKVDFIEMDARGTLSGERTCIGVSFEGDGLVVGFPPRAPPAAWLSAGIQDATAGHASVCLSESIYGSGWGLYGPGRYQTTLRITTGRQDGTDIKFVDLDVALTIPLAATPVALILAAEPGGTTASAVVRLDGAGIDWRVSSSSPRLTLAPSSGTGSGPLTLRFDPTGLTAGIHRIDLAVHDLRTGLATPVQVLVTVDPARWAPSVDGIGFKLVAARSALERTVRVDATVATGARWTASSPAAWLHLDGSSGGPGDDLVLRADPTGLPDGLYTAAVTIASEGGATGPRAATVGVGFYLATINPPSSGQVALASQQAVVDPIRPFVYSAAGGSVATANVECYSPEQGFAAGADLRALAITSDGARLYALDASGLIYPIDLETGAVGVALTGAADLQPLSTHRLQWLRVDGHEFLVASAMDGSISDTRVLALPSGEATSFTLSGVKLAWAKVAPGGRSLLNASGGRLERWRLAASAGGLSGVWLGSMYTPASSYGLDATGDRLLVYGYPWFEAYDLETFARLGSVAGDGGSIDTCAPLLDGRVVCYESATKLMVVGADLAVSSAPGAMPDYLLALLAAQGGSRLVGIGERLPPGAHAFTYWAEAMEIP